MASPAGPPPRIVISGPRTMDGLSSVKVLLGKVDPIRSPSTGANLLAVGPVFQRQIEIGPRSSRAVAGPGCRTSLQASNPSYISEQTACKIIYGNLDIIC